MLTRKNKTKQPLKLVFTNRNTKSMDEKEAFQPTRRNEADCEL